MSLTINGAAIESPVSFKVTPFRIERKDRTADGSLVTDVIATKRVFEIGYYELTGSELSYWTTLYDAGAPITFTYPRNSSTQSSTCWITDLAKEMVLESPEVWQGVTITMEEI